MQEKITKKKVRIGKGKISIGEEKKSEKTKAIIAREKKSFESVPSHAYRTKEFRVIKVRKKPISSTFPEIKHSAWLEKKQKIQAGSGIRVEKRTYVAEKKNIFNTAIPKKIAIKKKDSTCSIVPNYAKRRFHRLKIRRKASYLEHPEIIRDNNYVLLASNVPKIGTKKFSRINVREDLNLIPKPVSIRIPSRNQGVLETQREEERNQEISEAPEEAEKGEEIPDFFKLLSGWGAEKIPDGKPICIIVEKGEEEYEELIASLCRDIFREKEGGKPKPIHRGSIEELSNEFETLVERKLIVVKEVESSSKELIQILKDFFSQDMGFLILVSSNPLKLEEEIRKEEGTADIIILNSIQGMEVEEKREKFLNSIRGIKSYIQRESLGEEFKRSNDHFDEKAKGYLNNLPSELSKDRDKLFGCSPDDYDQASDLHSAMKAFVWIYEWKENGKKIKPYLETKDKGVDVEINDRNYEIETLFGVGDIGAKLAGKIKKYKEGEKIYFVMRNLDILRKLPLLWKFKEERRREGYETNFFGLDFDREKLVPLEEFKKLLDFLLEAPQAI